MSNLRINPEYAELVSPLSAADYEALRRSVKEHGLYSPIVINPEEEILDGHNRYRVCQELGIEPIVEVKTFEDKEEEKIFVIEANLKRRQLSDIERIALIHKLEPIEAALAKRRQVANLKSGSSAPISRSGSDEHNGEAEGRTREIMVEKAGVSPTAYYKGKTILEEGSEEVKEKVRSGKMSISQGFKKTRPQKNESSKEAKDFLLLSASLFDTISEAIEDAKNAGKQNIKLHHDRHQVIGTDALEVAVS